MISRYTILCVEHVAAAFDFCEGTFGLERLFLHQTGAFGELSTGETGLAFSSNASMRQQTKMPVRKPRPSIVKLDRSAPFSFLLMNATR